MKPFRGNTERGEGEEEKIILPKDKIIDPNIRKLVYKNIFNNKIRK